ncbi:MAG: hypothetical protein KL863_27780 [Rhizobium sp.]|nr:hypothetical protein [Rhizobium sp.]
MSATQRMVIFLGSLSEHAYSACPHGVGQKTVNAATEAGYIVSSKGQQTSGMPDRHRLTRHGVEALEVIMQRHNLMLRSPQSPRRG